jgi:colicin import membrane protein
MSKDLALQQAEWDLHENPNVVPLEFTEEIKPDLFGLELTKAQEMTSGLSTTLAEREILKDAYIDVIGLEITTENLPTFKELRLKIVKNRTQGLDKWKEREKAFYLAGGRFVDAIYNKELKVNQEMESKLMEAEKFFENQEKEKARSLNLERIEKIRPYVEDADKMNFSEFDGQSFDDFVLGKKTRFENEQKEREAESLRIEKELLAEIERQKAIEAENARLKAEAEEKEKELEKERAEAKAKQEAIELEAKQEREKAEKERKIEADKQAKIQAEKDAEIAKLKAIENAKIEAERLAKIEVEKLAKAPIKKQLNVWVDSFKIDIPDNALLNNDTALLIKDKFEAFKKWSKSEIEKL